MRWLVVLGALAGCAGSDSVQCASGRVCPSEQQCDDTHGLCIEPEQATVCGDLADGAECSTSGDRAISGHCLDGICLPSDCGDTVIELGEMCDDGNRVDDLTCSADCTSTRLCGNGVVDASLLEQCDDGNLLDHDGCSSRCVTEAPHWLAHTLTPGLRTRAASAFDSRRKRAVIFGGYDGNGSTYGDTLEWTGADWIRIETPSSPPPRNDSAMAYDAKRGNIVLFGGFDNNYDLSDTWLWDGNTWTATNAAGPIERYGQMMAYDPAREVVVLFGGWNDYAFPDNRQSDTWEWDGTSWTQNTAITNVPPGREAAGFAYDPKLGKIVMVGGRGNDVEFLSDTWVYDGDWHLVSGAGAPAIAAPQVAFDPVGQRLVMFGGFNATFTAQSAAYTFNGTSWVPINLGVGPSARSGGALFNTGRELLLHGGNNGASATYEDTWLFDSSWSKPGDMGGRTRLAAVNDPVNARAIFFGGTDNAGSTTYATTFELTATGFSPITGAGPSKRADAAFAWDPLHGEAILFGGVDGSSYPTDTWRFSGNAWSNANPPQAPIGRAGPSLGFDGTQLYLYGGEDAISENPDPRVWNGTTWQPAAAVPNDLEARAYAAMGWDPIRERLIMYGGDEGSEPVADTWIWDGSAWSELANAFVPYRRAHSKLTWLPARQSLVLTGSRVESFDAYEWDGTRWKLIPATGAPVGRHDHAATATIDGGGILIYGGKGAGNVDVSRERWELRWDAGFNNERCDGSDLDGDGLNRCDDPDCWSVCTPLCPPGVACGTDGPRCGDGACSATRESCRTCPDDCGACAAVCGDYICDPGETACPGDCPM